MGREHAYFPERRKSNLSSQFGIECRLLNYVRFLGNGPSAMILSYILHGHIPYYTAHPPHPDPLLHAKLQDGSCLLQPDLEALTDHFAASRLSYSTQALPINVLLDTLLRPQGESDDIGESTNVEWRHEPDRAVSHLVIGDNVHAGGLWAEDPIPPSWDIQTLSYAGMLSLPGYTFAEYYRQVHACALPPFTRPTRRELSEYLRLYPTKVDIDRSVRCGLRLSGVERTQEGFFIPSHNLKCRRLVLATGIFSHVLQPGPLLQPLLTLPPTTTAALLVIGSGFSAADAIISASKDQPLLHIFRWDPENRPSPLRACHQQAYPEYAGIYRLMKRAALRRARERAPSVPSQRPKTRRLPSTPFLQGRSWEDVYEGYPNTEVVDVHMRPEHDTALVTLRLEDGTVLTRAVSGLAFCVGRRGSLDYLDDTLKSEVLSGATVPCDPDGLISGKTLRGKVMQDLEVARDVFVTGSLTGDSLIRFAYGGCVYAASKLILGDSDRASEGERAVSPVPLSSGRSSHASTPKRPAGTPTGGKEALLNGVEGHGPLEPVLSLQETISNMSQPPLDRRKDSCPCITPSEVHAHKQEPCPSDKPRLGSWLSAFMRLVR